MTMTTSDTPRTNAAIWSGETLNEIHCASHDEAEALIALLNGSRQLERELLAARDDNFNLANALSKAEAKVEELKKGKVFVDPKWIYDLETQLAKAHEELCQAGLREYGV